MNGTPDGGGHRHDDAPPWEPQVRLPDWRGAFSDPMSTGVSQAGSIQRFGMHSKGHAADAESGLTRRGVIYEYIRAHPGAHVRGIAKDLQLATGALQYHLFWLEKHGFVKTKRVGFYRFVYPTMVFKETQELLLGVLTQKTPREILLCLLDDPSMTQGDLAKSLGHSQPTISWHIDRLIQSGVLTKNRMGRGTFYRVLADRDDILSFVKSYHRETWRRWAGRLSNVIASPEGSRIGGGESIQRATIMPPAVVRLIGNG